MSPRGSCPLRVWGATVRPARTDLGERDQNHVAGAKMGKETGYQERDGENRRAKKLKRTFVPGRRF